MDTRRSRDNSRSQALAQVRWLGWVMLMMFVLVQTATGTDGAGDRVGGFRQVAPVVPSNRPGLRDAQSTRGDSGETAPRKLGVVRDMNPLRRSTYTPCG
jgi:hypothetical protein